jgi:hypothetical protein
MKCDDGLMLVADHAVSGGPYHWSWNERRDKTPNHGRGDGIPPSDYAYVIDTVRVSCETGRDLVNWVQKMDDDNLVYNWIYDCHWFAQMGILHAATGDKECD